MHIVQVLLDERIGGAERLAAILTREWQRDGDLVEVLFVDPRGTSRTDPLSRLFRLRAALRASRPDLVIAHSALPNLYTRAAAAIGTPVVAVLHSAQDDFDDRGLRATERLLHRRGTVVAVSDAQREVYRRRFPAARTVTIANGIDPELPRRGRRSAGAAPLRLVTVSRIAEQKRPVLWQRIARGSAHLPVQFEWFGPAVDAAAAALVATHRESGAAGRFMGPTDAVGSVLAHADALVHTADREASSIGLMEAAAVGLPIICSSGVAPTLPQGLVWATFEDAADAVGAVERLAREYDAAEEHAELWRERIRTAASASVSAASYRALADRD